MRDLGRLSRVVVKIGTNLLAPDGLPGEERMTAIAEDVAAMHASGCRPLLVSSGAIGFGAGLLKMQGRPRKVQIRQACAAVGQPVLMDSWRKALEKHGIVTAQILLSRESFDDRKSYLNLRNAVESLLSLGTVPILNENDSVSTAEIGAVFGDNDSLSAHVASKLNADLLILLTDIDAFYDKDPGTHPDARPLGIVEELTEQLRSAAGKAGSEHSTGGMVTKIGAVDVAARAGCSTILADGRIRGILSRIMAGDDVGTLFQAGEGMGARARWILGARPKGTLDVDAGAMKALASNKSLLPTGISNVSGLFAAGDVVDIGTRYRAVVSMGSEEIRRVMGRHSSDTEKLLGKGRRPEAALVEDIIAIPDINFPSHHL